LGALAAADPGADGAPMVAALGVAPGALFGWAAVTAAGEEAAGDAAVAGGRDPLAHPASATAMLESHRFRAR